MGALRALSDAGIRVPEDMSVISIGNGEPVFAAYAIPALTNVYLPMESMAERCLEMVLRQVESHEELRERVWLDTPLILRESVGPAPH